MKAVGIVVLAALAAGCSGSDGPGDGERYAALRAARDGMYKVRALPGGKQATFTAVRLVRGKTVCGTIDGNDGTGPRGFAALGDQVLLADPRDAATVAAVGKACDGPARDIVSRNEQFTDIDLAD